MRFTKRTIVLAFMGGGLIGLWLGKRCAEREIYQAYSLAEKNKYIYRVALKWLEREKAGKGIDQYLKKRQIHNVAVYGLGYLGKTLVECLKANGDTNIYGIDNGTVSFNLDIPIYTGDDELPEADVVIVTALSSYREIEKELIKKTNAPVVSLADIVFER